ncbi:Heterogeneous nuclear ribonucleoprotein E2 [Intoshia linei]|uniref:Heterogeneous nuclear ribonucleoprotein E2 n=1 Tax=Intoshia linei TaxID=1819745 RepID=A0A177B7V1_9BILA|nr:Heterogeneous nuclear ribonucleoprotein E2 [Intoshia linei]
MVSTLTDIKYFERKGARNSQFFEFERFEASTVMDNSNVGLEIDYTNSYSNYSFAGGLIGKAGENIKRLRIDYNSTILLSNSPSPERIVTIKTESDKLKDLFYEIIPYVNGNKSQSYIISLLIHQSLAGGIIGSGGKNIQELRSITKANIKVFSDCCPGSTERIVQVSGDLDCVVDAGCRVVDKAFTSPCKGVERLYIPSNFDSMLEGGQPSAPRGGRERMGREDRRRSGPYDRREERNQYSKYDHRNKGMDYMEQPGYEQQYPSNVPRLFDNRSYEHQTSIPSGYAGAIIGKGGERINMVRHATNATINIDTPDDKSSERVITISGTIDQIQEAEAMLQDLVRKHVRA